MTDQTLLADGPIDDPSADEFGRRALAERIAMEALNAPPDAGFVIALCGPWGSGKTSVANLAIRALQGSTHKAVRFNPWAFSGSVDLIGQFFRELGNTLGQSEGQLRDIAAKIGRYAGILSKGVGLIPGVGSTAQAVLTAAESVASAAGRGPTLNDQRQELIEALKQYDGRIVVFLDDIDRLTDEEIRDVVRLVKLVGDLPRVTYVLAFDRARVEQALGAPDPDPVLARERGRAFIEKIVQSEHDVPPLRDSELLEHFIRRVNAAVAVFPQPEVFHEHDFNNMLGLAFRHMVRTPRDSVRVANALPAAVEALAGEVALADVVGLETLRVLEPTVHARLPEVSDILTGKPRLIGDEAEQATRDQERLDSVMGDARQPDAVRSLLGQLFPKADRALAGRGRGFQDERRERRERRVAVAEVFGIYLHRALDEGTVAAADVRNLLALFEEPARLHDTLAQLPPATRADAIDRLIDFEDDFRPGHAFGVANAILPLGWDLPEQSIVLSGKARGSTRLKWLIGKLLLAEPEGERGAVAEALVQSAPDLSTRMRLLRWFGTDTTSSSRDPDAELIAEHRTQSLLEEVRAAVADAPAELLAREPALHSLIRALHSGDPAHAREVLEDKTADEGFMLAVVSSYLVHGHSVTSGEAAIRRDAYVNWRGLVSDLGESVLRARLEGLREQARRGSLEGDTQTALDQSLAIIDGRAEPRTEPC